MANIQTTQQLGEVLRNARKQLGVTQSQLALATGVSLRFIVDLEAGKSTLQLNKALQVIAVLGGTLSLDGLPDRVERSKGKKNAT